MVKDFLHLIITPSVATASLNLKFESSLQICEYIERTFTLEESRWFLRCLLQATQKDMKDALSHLFIADTAKIEGGMKKPFYKFTEKLLKNIAENGAYENI